MDEEEALQECLEDLLPKQATLKEIAIIATEQE
jgi:hypothetical protein